jgi:hypothetical protein
MIAILRFIHLLIMISFYTVLTTIYNFIIFLIRNDVIKIGILESI